MSTFLALLRGINVGGKNAVPMSGLRQTLEGLGYSNVSTYIASGNVILSSDKRPAEIKAEVEAILPRAFRLDSDLIKVHVLSRAQLQSVIEARPKGFGEKPEMYHSDAIFLMDITLAAAMSAFDPRPGVDNVWPGDGVIYSQRLSSQRTKSRLNKMLGTAAYKSMTIRSWSTTTTLLDLLSKAETTDGSDRARG